MRSIIIELYDVCLKDTIIHLHTHKYMLITLNKMHSNLSSHHCYKKKQEIIHIIFEYVLARNKIYQKH